MALFNANEMKARLLLENGRKTNNMGNIIIMTCEKTFATLNTFLEQWRQSFCLSEFNNTCSMIQLIIITTQILSKEFIL